MGEKNVSVSVIAYSQLLQGDSGMYSSKAKKSLMLYNHALGFISGCCIEGHS